MKKEFVSGLYPEEKFRLERLTEIEQTLNVLVSNREELNKQINQLLYEAKILTDLNQLQKFINGEINIKIQETKNE